MKNITNVSVKDLNFKKIYSNRADAQAGKNAINVNKIYFGDDDDTLRYNTETGLISKKTKDGYVPMGYSNDVEVIDLSLDDNNSNSTNLVSGETTVKADSSQNSTEGQFDVQVISEITPSPQPSAIPAESDMTNSNQNNSDAQVISEITPSPQPSAIPAESDMTNSSQSNSDAQVISEITPSPQPSPIPAESDMANSNQNSDAQVISEITPSPQPSPIPAESDMTNSNQNNSGGQDISSIDSSTVSNMVPGESAMAVNLSDNEKLKLRQLGLTDKYDYGSLSVIKEKINQLIGHSGNWMDFLDKYKDFSNIVEDSNINLGYGSKYVPQGLCSSEDGTFISAYQEGEKSVIKYFNSDNIVKDVKLDLAEGTHVGGISYDSNGQNFYVCSENGNIAVFSRDSIINANDGIAVKPTYEFSTGLSTASYLTVHGDKLYAGTFKEHQSGVVKEFSLSNDGTSVKSTGYEFSVPEKVQGMSLYTNNDGKTTLALSCSYGRTNDSSLKLFDFNKSENSYTNPKESIKTPPMLEQIQFDGNGKLECVFESGSEKYFTEKARNNGQPIKSTCILNIQSKVK